MLTLIGRYGYGEKVVSKDILSLTKNKRQVLDLLKKAQHHIEAVDAERLSWQKEYHDLKAKYFRTPAKRKEERDNIVNSLVDIEEILTQLNDDAILAEKRITLIERRLMELNK